MNQAIFEKLKEPLSYDEIFELAKRAVEQVLGMHRAGLCLVLGKIPNYIGAYHVLGSDTLVMNKTILDLVRTQARSNEDLNGYIFTILLHEYLHSLGITDETRVRRLAYQVCIQTLGREHHATKVATGKWEELYPELKYLGPGRVGNDFEVIKDFDKSSTSYIT